MSGALLVLLALGVATASVPATRPAALQFFSETVALQKDWTKICSACAHYFGILDEFVKIRDLPNLEEKLFSSDIKFSCHVTQTHSDDETYAYLCDDLKKKRTTRYVFDYVKTNGGVDSEKDCKTFFMCPK